MKSKVVITIAVILIATLMSGCKKKEATKMEAPEEKLKVETPAETKPAKVVTDDEFVEYWAQIAYLAEKYQKDPMRYSKEMANLFERLGLTEKEGEQFSARYEEWLSNWQKRVMTDPEKASKEWDAIIKKFEKRLAELKAGK